MAIPDYQSLMLPVLQTLADRDEVSIAETRELGCSQIEAIRRRFGGKTAERKAGRPSSIGPVGL